MTVFSLGWIDVTIDAKLKNHKTINTCKINHENVVVIDNRYCLASDHNKCCKEPKIKLKNSNITRVNNIDILLIQSNNINTVKITKDNKVVDVELKPNITKADIIAIVKSKGVDIPETLVDVLLKLPSMIDNSPDDGKD